MRFAIVVPLVMFVGAAIGSGGILAAGETPSASAVFALIFHNKAMIGIDLPLTGTTLAGTLPADATSAQVCLASGPALSQFAYAQANYRFISAINQAGTGPSSCLEFPIPSRDYSTHFTLVNQGVFARDERVFPHILGDTQYVPRELETILGESQSTYSLTHDSTAKMQPYTILTWLSLPETFDPPIELLVYTKGAPASVPMSGKAGVVAMATHRTTLEEAQAIAAHGVTAGLGSDNSWMGVFVAKKSDIAAIAALPFVYAIQIIDKPKVDSTVYDLSDTRTQQKEVDASLRRPSQTLTSSAKIALLEGSGYDSGYSQWLSPNVHIAWSWNMNNPAPPPTSVCCSGQNHGTLVADLLSKMIYDGGSFYIYQANGATQDRNALSDAHTQGLDVFSMSFEYIPTNNQCKSDYDSQLYNFISFPYSFAVAATGNDGFTDKVGYPASSALTVSVGGVDGGTSPWARDAGSNYGTMVLSSTNCPQQYNLMIGTQYGANYPSPTVYGYWCSRTDKALTACGTSLSAPEIAGGMAEIASRCYYKSDCSIYQMNLNTIQCGKRAGGWYLAARSNSPNGRGIQPAAAWKLGALSDHDAWYQDSWVPTC